ncbi:hypothetical protein N0V94_002626 [Neodidymelliopsis sp. IMI 364377]|nr:hypothetical protein N0V94_002626 [Neodidymelliopsis sp. IMI 364377]
MAMNRRKDHEQQSHSSLQIAEGASHTSQFHLAGHMTGPTTAPSLQGGEAPLHPNMDAQSMHSNSGHRMEALLNAAQHLEPTAYPSWQPPNSMHPDNYRMPGHHDNDLGPPIDPSMESLSFAPPGTVPNFDPWTFDLMQNHHTLLSQTPSNSLRSWLFPAESNLGTPNGSHPPELDNTLHDEAALNTSHDQGSPSGSAMSIVSKIPQERFARVSQNQGIFSVNDGTDVGSLLNSIDDEEAKWKAWINIESVKR